MIEQVVAGGLTLGPRIVPLGGMGGVSFQRVLPHRDLRMVGPWCLLDRFGPSIEPLAVLPHPHAGLQTLTWPLGGEIRHRDSLGNDLAVRVGELNLMTAGAGVAHSEFDTNPARPAHGLQLWVALPEAARHGRATFEHHGFLPRASGYGWEAVVLLGELDGVQSPASAHSPLTGAELTVTGPIARIPARPDFEYALMGLDGPIMVDAVQVPAGSLRCLPSGTSEIIVRTEPGTTMLLLGGEPLPDDLLMWWNFIARTADEIAVFREAWNEAAGGFSARFGEVRGHRGAWIPAPPLPSVRLRPRQRR
jgi:redox-sensitive bicupin YhaK (pirin superfamily)